MRIILLFCFAIILVSCANSPGENEGGYLNKEQVLKTNPDANYFTIDGKVYVTDIEDLDDVKVTKGKQIGEIKKGMSNHLPIGSKIYEPRERKDILIVEQGGMEKLYLLQVGE